MPIDTVPGDGHQVTFGGHDVTQQGQMPIVDIKTVKVQHEKDFFLHSSPHSFDAQNLETRKKRGLVTTSGAQIDFWSAI